MAEQSDTTENQTSGRCYFHPTAAIFRLRNAIWVDSGRFFGQTSWQPRSDRQPNTPSSSPINRNSQTLSAFRGPPTAGSKLTLATVLTLGRVLLTQRYNIEHVTLQPEIGRQMPTFSAAPRVVTL